MSPVSRGRKKAKAGRSGQRVVKTVAEIPEPCDCPDCASADIDADLAEIIDDLISVAGEVTPAEDPLEAEMFGASIMSMGAFAGDGFRGALSEEIVPELETRSGPGALTALLAIDAVELRAGAGEAAGRLLAAGLPAPAWTAELREPVKVTLCRRFGDAAGEESTLLCCFERAGRSHGLVIHVDHGDCHAATDIMLFPGESLDEVSEVVRTGGPEGGETLTVEELPEAEFRWQVERALAARAVHDLEAEEPELPDESEDGPPYHLLAALLQARMATLTEPTRPPAPHS